MPRYIKEKIYLPTYCVGRNFKLPPCGEKLEKNRLRCNINNSDIDNETMINRLHSGLLLLP